MNTRQALTRYGKTVHETDDDRVTFEEGTPVYQTFCGYRAVSIESEEEGTRQAWRIRTRDMRRCRRCELEVERRAEHA